MSERWSFEKVGLGYRCWNEAIETEFRISHIKRSSETLSGELAVHTNLANVKTNKGLMHLARFNVLSSTSRSSLAKQLAARAPDHNMDWYDGLETLCQMVIKAEQQGEDVVYVGHETDEVEENHFLVEPLILNNQPSMIFGPGGSGKSVIALACALSLITGREIIPGIQPHRRGNAMYLDWETDKETINRRLHRIARGHGFPPPPLLYRASSRPFSEQVEAISALVDKHDIDLIVIDSAEKSMGAGHERADANEATMRLHEAVRLIGVSTLIIDHINKVDLRSKPGQATPYGSAFKTWMVRSSWEIRRVGDESDREHLKTVLFHAKSNDTALYAPLGIRIDYPPTGEKTITFSREDVDVEPESYGSAPVVIEKTVPEMVQELLAGGSMYQQSVIPDLIPSRNKLTVMKAVQRGLDKGVLVRDEKGFIGLAPVDDSLPLAI